MKKLAIFDLDGTLFNTTSINYLAYKEALSIYGYELEHAFFSKECNGKHYAEFLPKLINLEKPKDSIDIKKIVISIHEYKKIVYKKYIDKAIPNKQLINIIKLLKSEYNIALVTTATHMNCFELLEFFEIQELFDLIITGEDVFNTKPNPEGFLKAVSYFGVKKENVIVFEDSIIGEETAMRAGLQYFLVRGFN